MTFKGIEHTTNCLECQWSYQAMYDKEDKLEIKDFECGNTQGYQATFQ